MKILIIHTAFIGDIVLSTPLLRKIKDLYPEAKIDYLTTPQGEAILKNNPNLNKVIVYDKKGKDKGVRSFYNLVKELKKERYEMTVSLHRYIRSSILSWGTGAKIRKGYDNAAGAFLYTEKIKYDKGKCEVEKILSFFEKNIKKTDDSYNIELYPGVNEKKVVDSFFNEKKEGKLVAIAPGSKWFTKKWPLEYFNKIVEELGKKEGITQVIVGGNEEKLLSLKLQKNCIDLRGKTTLLQLGEVLSRCDIVLTNDSSPIHIASAFLKPYIIAIFGPTVREFGFYPWSKNSYVFETNGLSCRPCSIHGGDKCPQGHFKCMLEIKPENVLKKIEEILER